MVGLIATSSRLPPTETWRLNDSVWRSFIKSVLLTDEVGEDEIV